MFVNEKFVQTLFLKSVGTWFRRRLFRGSFPILYWYIITIVWKMIKNKRPMDHIDHLRNQFKSMNTFERSYDFIYYKTGPVVQEEKIL